MYIIRPITSEDTEAFIQIAFSAGMGMTSIPKNRQLLQKRVAESEKAFAKDVAKPGDESYLFVLENTEKNKIGGTCGINAKTGLNAPLYFYRLESKQQYVQLCAQTQTIPYMRIVSYTEAPSEVCSLFLTPEFRHGGLGRLLSLSRFLFMAAHPHRFDKMTYAEMRGYIVNNISPFWEGIGRHFANMQFAELMHLRDEETIEVASALPSTPIYIHLLPKEVQESIGKIHPHTEGALAMLIHEGFILSDEIDIFDGGPKIEVETREIRSIKSSVVATVAEILPTIDSCQYLVSNNRLDFRACIAPIQIEMNNNVAINSETAEAIKINVGDKIRYVTLQGAS